MTRFELYFFIGLFVSDLWQCNISGSPFCSHLKNVVILTLKIRNYIGLLILKVCSICSFLFDNTNKNT